MAMDFFKCYDSYAEALAMLNDEQLGRLMRALMAYSKTGEVSELGPVESVAFAFIRRDIDLESNTYEERCKKNKDNVKRRWKSSEKSEATEVTEVTDAPESDESAEPEQDGETEPEAENAGTEKPEPVSLTKSKKPERHQYGEYKNVLLSDLEYSKLKAEYPDRLDDLIERMSGYCAQNRKSYKNCYAAIRNWAAKDCNKPNPPKFTNARDQVKTLDYELAEQMLYDGFSGPGP